ncbi:MAG: ErfK/YbiS/YcfS/YnhG family protein, partial [Acidimicrobiaceae bacterium]|nr:ErfK/YbiS/YcfS/YnhG family protein [Acidimicrobiaceae bacterium]
AVWSALERAVAERTVSSHPYDYLIATETLPETIYVWRDGRIIYQTLTNSGVSQAPTEQGTWPVYVRYTTTTMTGTNPDGSHYSDPGIPNVAYFHGGDAVHGFIRSGYGYPQSVGCLEIPISNSAVMFPLDPIGTLVTVTTGNLVSELSGASAPSTSATPSAPPTTVPATTTTVPATTTTVPATTTTVPATTTTVPATTTTAAAPTTTAPSAG